jgi:ubiquinone/menaquinone biosynthesis C-methylase UbiE
LLKGLMRAVHGPIYQRRLRALTEAIVPHLRAGDRVLDVGCGVGTLGRAILDDPGCPAGVVVRGAERSVRGGEPIEVVGYDGVRLPFGDGSHEVVIVADVLHHEVEEDRLVGECVRVASRAVIVKDHLVKGLLAQQRIGLIDWAANAPHGVKCLYRYHTEAQWREIEARHGLVARERRLGMRVYPAGWEQAFGGSLHYFAVLEKPGARL